MLDISLSHMINPFSLMFAVGGGCLVFIPQYLLKSLYRLNSFKQLRAYLPNQADALSVLLFSGIILSILIYQNIYYPIPETYLFPLATSQFVRWGTIFFVFSMILLVILRSMDRKGHGTIHQLIISVLYFSAVTYIGYLLVLMNFFMIGLNCVPDNYHLFAVTDNTAFTMGIIVVLIALTLSVIALSFYAKNYMSRFICFLLYVFILSSVHAAIQGIREDARYSRGSKPLFLQKQYRKMEQPMQPHQQNLQDFQKQQPNLKQIQEELRQLQQ